MADRVEKLYEALGHADVARAALRFVRPTAALMQLHIRHGDYDAAVSAGLAGLAAARSRGLSRWTRVVRGVRSRAPVKERVFADLDEALGEL